MFSSVPHPIVIVRRAWLTLLMIAAGAAALSAQTTLRSIGASTVADEAIVTIEASGTLPTPTVGALDGPPRIFLDFAGVDVRLEVYDDLSRSVCFCRARHEGSRRDDVRNRPALRTHRKPSHQDLRRHPLKGVQKTHYISVRGGLPKLGALGPGGLGGERRPGH